MTKPAPILASAKTAARLLDMRESEFKALVDQRLLPQPREIAGLKRWDVEELRAIGRGDAAFGMTGVEW